MGHGGIDNIMPQHDTWLSYDVIFGPRGAGGLKAAFRCYRTALPTTARTETMLRNIVEMIVWVLDSQFPTFVWGVWATACLPSIMIPSEGIKKLCENAKNTILDFNPSRRDPNGTTARTRLWFHMSKPTMRIQACKEWLRLRSLPIQAEAQR